MVLNDLSSLWLAPIFRLYGLKVVSLLHLYLQRKNSAGFGHGWLEFQLLRVTSRSADLVYSVNKDNQKSFAVPVNFVGNFISPWFFEAPGSAGKRYDLGLIARLSVEKNVPLFVRLVATLNDFAGRPVTALIVGKGEDESLVRDEIERLGMGERIDIRPWVDRGELPAVFDELKCFAITSHHEGFATTILEAHARGVPSISTRSAGFCAEFLEYEGENTGLLFDPVDIESNEFLHDVLALIDNSERYAEACRRKAAKFNEQRVLGEIKEGLDTLLQQHSVISKS